MSNNPETKSQKEELLSLKIIHHESVRSKARSQKIEYQLEKVILICIHTTLPTHDLTLSSVFRLEFLRPRMQSKS